MQKHNGAGITKKVINPGKPNHGLQSPIWRSFGLLQALLRKKSVFIMGHHVSITRPSLKQNLKLTLMVMTFWLSICYLQWLNQNVNVPRILETMPTNLIATQRIIEFVINCFCTNNYIEAQQRLICLPKTTIFLNIFCQLFWIQKINYQD